MRFTYIFAVIIAATLHASGNALSTAKESNHAAISHVASADVQANHGRLLRRVEKDGVKELENEIEEEERTLKNFGASLKRFAAKHTPFTKSWKEARKVRKIAEADTRARNNYKNFIASGGKPEDLLHL
ncbi:hypothetical protein PRIC1_004873 [Phytophthora ramorum]|uniref:RxLR effector protein Avh23 n=1 Tax=Phytophthora ramorum TaxID=164328 RepID=UPI0030AEF6E5|nr:RxLR effector protein Avh23 [Phytophthora ramorum]